MKIKPYFLAKQKFLFGALMINVFGWLAVLGLTAL